MEPAVPAPHPVPLIPDTVDVDRLTRDPLTGVSASWLVDDRLEQVVRRHGRSGRVGALLLVDVDRLAVVNDVLGLGAGDEVLRAVARRIGAQLHDGDTLGRTGDDEFAVLVEELLAPDGARAVADAVLGAMQDPFLIGEDTAMVAVSIGMVAVDGSQPAAELWRRAELALARAKRRGGSCHAAYEGRTTHGVDRRLDVEWALRRRLERGEIEFRYRPTVELRTGSLALVTSTPLTTWHEVGELDPAVVHQAAAASGLAESLFALELTVAVQRSAAWPRRPTVGVEVPAAALGGPMVAIVEGALDRAGLRGESLLLVMPGAAIDDAPATAEALSSLRRAGVRVGLDLGGRVPLDVLRTVPADVLVLPGSLLDDLHDDRARAVAGAVLGIAEVLDAVVIASGIDGDAHLEAARSLGVDLVHGDRIGLAVDAAELSPWFTRSADHAERRAEGPR